jgi:hypothetical protein
MPWATRMWPGLPRIWSLGSWSGLAQAVGFALVVNLAVLGSFYWVELLPSGLLTLVWLAIGVFWVGSAIFSSIPSAFSSPPKPDCESETDSFSEATEHYLRGNWYEAQRVLGDLLRQNPRDMEAGLMWATVLRHAGRIDEAGEQLDRLELFEGHHKWGMEICRERELLAQLRQEKLNETAENAVESSTADAA